MPIGTSTSGYSWVPINTSPSTKSCRIRKFRSKPVSISDEEFMVQVSLGVLKDIHEIAYYVRHSTTHQVIEWALTHNTWQVRHAVLSSKACTFKDMVSIILLDRSKFVRNAATTKIRKKYSKEQLEAAINALHAEVMNGQRKTEEY